MGALARSQDPTVARQLHQQGVERYTTRSSRGVPPPRGFQTCKKLILQALSPVRKEEEF